MAVTQIRRSDFLNSFVHLTMQLRSTLTCPKCSDQAVENAAFVAYGLKFAELLGLPETVTAITPLNRQIPERYCPLFAEGCRNAMDKQVPARFSGSFEHDIQAELFRAVFLPIRLQPGWSKWLIFGSFNCRTVLSVDRIAQ